MSAVPQSSDNWQAGFLNVLPAVQTHAQIQFRRLPAEKREQAIQEAIASACVSYQLLAAQGKLHVARPGTLAMYAVNFVRNGRHIGGSQDAAKDAMSPAAQRRHHFKTASYDRFEREVGEWRQVAIEDRKTPIPDLAAFRIDFATWLKTITRRDRRIILTLAGGERTSAAANRFGISPARVSQLRRKYEQLWRAFQGEPATGEAA
jgi:hypothetical protein